MEIIPDNFVDLVSYETKSFAFLATLMSDSTPQVTPVWFDWDGEFIFINSAIGRTKDKNMRSRPFVAIAIQDPQNKYRYLQIRGKVVDIIESGAIESINRLAIKYTGSPWKGAVDETRAIYKIRPLHVQGYG